MAIAEVLYWQCKKEQPEKMDGGCPDCLSPMWAEARSSHPNGGQLLFCSIVLVCPPPPSLSEWSEQQAWTTQTGRFRLSFLAHTFPPLEWPGVIQGRVTLLERPEVASRRPKQPIFMQPLCFQNLNSTLFE